MIFNKLGDKKIIVIIVLAGICLFAAIYSSQMTKEDISLETLNSGNIKEKEYEIQNQIKKETESETVEFEEPKDAGVENIYVHVSGEVESPGIVEISEGSRLFEAIEMVGGLTEDGDMDSINLASIVVDQQKIVVGNINDKSRVLTTNGDSSQGDGSLININTASKSELTKLPGIGDVIAENIIDYRESNNFFNSKEEIKNVKRIGDSIFDELKEMITVN
ncbi:helix-hairpin-helix domain-containing protein [Alkalibacter mobilis]|uniref:helix-hairpin-helix domain-containing protein n=1 Tax=Alkalibacter mobilis TaxID=2787712 RepID=UPI00189E4169|nr:helix-hairpin-helix domain-containing protein [Alkalibacter mobilis]MBF7096565.1 helix-hairpin-helix domain-containing protein [Alkalibacter mobilis]